MRPSLIASFFAALAASCVAPRLAHACAWAFPVGDGPASLAPLSNGHPVGGGNLPHLGVHLGADYWSGGGCTDFGETVYAAADGVVVEVVDGLGSYLDVVVIEHQDPAVGTVYTMYGHIARNPEITEGVSVDVRQPIGEIDDVLAYFSPCHLHFEILSAEAYGQGPFCNGCAGAGYSVSPGYDQGVGVTNGQESSGDAWIEVNDAIAGNRWYETDAFIQARLDATCGSCGDGACDIGETFETCAADCDPCGTLPPLGGVVDDTDACFFLGGDPQWWHDADVGHGGSHRFTHTTDSALIDNFGIWTLAFADAGSYQVEVYVEPGAADSVQARYAIEHAGGVAEPVVSQAAGGWLDLGTFEMAAETAYTVRLDDNTGEPFSGMTRLAFDAVRATRLDPPMGSTGGDDGSPTTSSGDDGPATSNADTTGADADADAGGDVETTDDTATSGSEGGDPPEFGQPGASLPSGCRTNQPPTWPAALILLTLLTRRRDP
ncbi:MAG: peptidoglycan DD-metalloendopeptidase family protein [Myxococcota bacterium]